MAMGMTGLLGSPFLLGKEQSIHSLADGHMQSSMLHCEYQQDL
jgi:hypothetical protein